MTAPLRVAVLGEGAPDLVARLAPLLPADVWCVLGVSGEGAEPAAALTLLLAPDDLADPAVLAASAALRASIESRKTPCAVLHGHAGERLRQARAAIERLRHPPSPGAGPAWICGECSDPDCEHRLFRRLLRGTASAER